jgi:hypothetical protein
VRKLDVDPMMWVVAGICVVIALIKLAGEIWPQWQF